MIAAIGFMIGTYVMTRMIELLLAPENAIVVRVCALGTIAVALWGMFSIWWLAPPSSPMLPPFNI